MVFSSNSASFGGALASVGITGECLNDSRVIVEADFLYFKSNSAQNKSQGGAIFLQDTCFMANNSRSYSEFRENSARAGGAIYILNSQIPAAAVGKLTFFHNQASTIGGALYAAQQHPGTVISASFINNTAEICGGAVDVNGNGTIFMDTLATGNSNSAFCISGNLQFFGNTTFSRNTGETGGALYIQVECFVSFSGHTTFDGNIAVSGGGAIYAFRSNIVFHESICISHNSARNGGAIYLSGGTSMTVTEDVYLTTANNHASQYGGVIFYEDAATEFQCKYGGEIDELSQLPYCSIQFAAYIHLASLFTENYNGSTSIQITDSFILPIVNSSNDSSGIDGGFMYGGLLDRCQMKFLPSTLFEGFDGVHAITSQPYQLCFCNDEQTYGCTITVSLETNLGQMFEIPLLALDQTKASTSTHVSAKVSANARLKSKQSYQKLPSTCSRLKYTLYSTGDSEELILYSDGPCRDTGLAKVVVKVALLPCPHGFNKTSDECFCEKRLQNYGATCTIDEDVSITRGPDSRLWISALYDNTTYQGLILYHTCPVEYCIMEIVPVDLENPDIQCVNNRSGMLCGACATNYSLMLGSSRCGECSNTYLALILPFAAAGIALVVFLSILRLTVATGMINMQCHTLC